MQLAKGASGEEPGGEGPDADVFEWTPVEGSRVVDQVTDQIRERIFASLEPGDWIGTEVELAESLGVSRLAMRDAVRALRTLGLVEVRVGTGGGLRVAHSDPRRLAEALAVQLHQLGLNWRDVTDALLILEPNLAGLAALRRSDEDLQLMRLIIGQNRAALGDRRAFFESTSAFHVAIAAAAGNPALLLSVKSLRSNLNRLFAPLEDTVDRDATIADHEAILEAIEARDAVRATRLMEDHDSVMNPRSRASRRPSGAHS